MRLEYLMLMTVSYFIWENGKVTHKQKQVFAEKRNDIKNQLIEEHGEDFFHIRKVWDYA